MNQGIHKGKRRTGRKKITKASKKERKYKPKKSKSIYNVTPDWEGEGEEREGGREGREGGREERK